MQRHRQLYDAKARTQMPARDGDGLYAFLTQLARHAPQILKRAQAQICGTIDEVQHGGAESLLIKHRGFIH
jgi:hypothetical protein